MHAGSASSTALSAASYRSAPHASEVERQVLNEEDGRVLEIAIEKLEVYAAGLEAAGDREHDGALARELMRRLVEAKTSTGAV